MPTAFEVKFRDEVTRSSYGLNSKFAAWWTRLNSDVEMVDARLTDGSQSTVPHYSQRKCTSMKVTFQLRCPQLESCEA